MSKIVCDVCGTSFAETATHCPICGCVRPTESVVITSEHGGDETNNTGYTYVKGGRFSRTNVKKRSVGKETERISSKRPAKEKEASQENKGDKGLIVAVCLLLLAIVAVVIYIVIHFFGGQPEIPAQNQGAATTVTTEAPTEATTE
ncbi:MAG: hypothetical protein IKU18_01045, partial [Bacteroidales bacterium]|nr:hypothetical protein [Bacteroidales bacterium]